MWAALAVTSYDIPERCRKSTTLTLAASSLDCLPSRLLARKSDGGRRVVESEAIIFGRLVTPSAFTTPWVAVKAPTLEPLLALTLTNGGYSVLLKLFRRGRSEHVRDSLKTLNAFAFVLLLRDLPCDAIIDGSLGNPLRCSLSDSPFC